MEGSHKERMKVRQRQKLSKNISFFPVLSELRSVPCRSAAVKLPTAKLPISSSNGLLNNPRRWGCPEACEKKREVSWTEILPKEKDVDVCLGAGALSTTLAVAPLRLSSLSIAGGGRSNSRDNDDDADLRLLSLIYNR